MDSRDLRIGNWFYPIDRSVGINIPIEIPHIVVEVSEIHVKSHRVETPTHKVLKYDQYMLWEISPIPLTEEILLKCGFEKCTSGNYDYYLKVSAIKLYARKSCGHIYFELEGIYLGDTHLKHLHQLQNLYFALTGQELEVNL